MRNLLKSKTGLTFIILISCMIAIPVIFFLGVQYLAPIVMLVLVYLFIHKVKYEEIISPREFEEMNLYLRELEERASLIREHLEYHDSDLEAKFELREIDKEIEYIKKEMGL